MESKLAQQVEQALIEDMRRLTPQERLEAFITHCQLSMDLYLAGEQYRAQQRGKIA